jgi:hypothetical protein
MFKKIALASAAASALIAVPTAADARPHGYYGQTYGYNQGYYGNNGYYGRGYYNQGYSNGYYGRGYNNRYYYNGRRCSGTTGTVVGGVAGALLGNAIGRSGRGYYRRGGSGATGAILGGALGALAGRAIDRDSCRR